jgi:hypothetical protein
MNKSLVFAYVSSIALFLSKGEAEHAKQISYIGLYQITSQTDNHSW